MQITNPTEIFYLVILTVAIAYIFTGYIKKPRRSPLELLTKRGFDWENFKFALIIAAPAVVLHELGHKFAAIFFGIPATFHIWIFGLVLAIFLKWIRSPILFIAPGYVLIQAGATNVQNIIISFAGPFMNLVLFLGSWYILTHSKNLSRTTAIGLYLSKQINLLLLVFNMLPIPPLDGSHIFGGLLKLIIGAF